jgi:hypothetical protein
MLVGEDEGVSFLLPVDEQESWGDAFAGGRICSLKSVWYRWDG